ncbi:MAG: hypothetical protein KGJ03_06475 [Betaproteobacteria bacterium]|nr:hypothetical protein [Betaproteobacteria bacterium]MBU6513616.1 hypothetical protein [Betaproteobacteria bacterium]MDE1955346.1 hypothetical protein [Betaproteobacteria bacterium]MDE2153022.1 hypothetical protein [Betaproteobacteria bacterium]MDE2478777.1 hypothetical protein [Betaproteobacteria bacterium]
MRPMGVVAAALCLAAASGLLAPFAQAREPEKASFGAWVVGEASDRASVYAATGGDSGDVLGKSCSRDGSGCVWVLLTPEGCAAGARAPALLNASAGAAPVTLYCDGKRFQIGDADFYREVVLEPRIVEDEVRRSAGMLGVAYPLQSGAFKADRFNLAGVADALSALRGLSAPAAPARPPAPAPAIPPSTTRSGVF